MKNKRQVRAKTSGSETTSGVFNPAVTPPISCFNLAETDLDLLSVAQLVVAVLLHLERAAIAEDRALVAPDAGFEAQPVPSDDLFC